MSHSRSLNEPVMNLITENVDGVIILDVAQGLGNWGYNIRISKKGTPILIGLDIWIPYVEKINGMNIYDYLIICDVRKPPLRPKSSDILLASEILEHISRSEADVFLEEMEKLYKQTLIVTTPKGFRSQGPLGGNPHQRHVSGWQERELRERGYETKTVYFHPVTRSIRLVINLRRKFLKTFLGISSDWDLIIAWKN